MNDHEIYLYWARILYRVLKNACILAFALLMVAVAVEDALAGFELVIVAGLTGLYAAVLRERIESADAEWAPLDEK